MTLKENLEAKLAKKSEEKKEVKSAIKKEIARLKGEFGEHRIASRALEGLERLLLK